MGSNLTGFYKTFSSSDGRMIRTLDTLNTFDISFRFYPRSTDKKKKKGLLDKITDSVVGAAQSAVSSAVNNLTGGLAASFMNDKKAVKKEHDSFDRKDGKQSMMNYLAPANMFTDATSGIGAWIGGTSGGASKDIELDLSYYIQRCTLPDMQIVDSDVSKTALGEFPVNGIYIKPTTTTFTLEVLNTQAPILERLFYPWMREVTLPYWSYSEQPFTTADVTIDMTKHADIKYNFYGVRPKQIQTYDPSQENNNMTRQVIFMFDIMTIDSKLKTMESIGDKLKALGKSLLSSGASILKI